MPTMRFGSQSEHVEIDLPQSFSTDGWARARVRVSAERFTATIDPYLEASDFARFLKSLETLFERLDGRAELKPLEKQFSLTLIGNGKGRISVSGEACSMTYANTLQFAFDIDQTYLVEPLAQLKAIYAPEHESGA